jgi:hypothetical protein
MSYAKIIAKKIRMCARFGHLRPASRRLPVRTTAGVAVYYCTRCGAIVERGGE